MFKKLIVSKRLRRRVSWVSPAILILPFIIFFHASSQAPSRGPGGSAGVIFGKHIPWETFQEVYQVAERRVESQLGEIPDALKPLLVQSTWDWLMLLEEARRRHLGVTDAQLLAAIQREVAFQDHGRFNRELYGRLLARNGLTPQRYERHLREQLMVESLIDSVKASVTVNDEDVKAAYARSHERLKALMIFFDPASFRREAEAPLTDGAIRTRYETHPEAVRVPEQITVESAGLSREELMSKVQLREEEVTAFYQDHRSQFANPDGTVKPLEEVRELIHRSLAEARVNQQLRALAFGLEEDVEAKTPFEEILKSRALSPHAVGPFPVGTSSIPKGLAPALLDAVEGLGEGQVSRVTRTENGVYLARVAKRIPSRLPPLEEVRATIRDRLIQEHAKALAKQAAEALQERLKTQRVAGVRFEEAAVTGGRFPVRSVSFTRTGPIDPIGEGPPVNPHTKDVGAGGNTAAFNTPLGDLTDVLETAHGFVILRPEERVPADMSKFADEAAAIRQETLERQQSVRFQAWLEEVRRRANLRSVVDTPKKDRPNR